MAVATDPAPTTRPTHLLPPPRGPISAFVITHLRRPPHPLPRLPVVRPPSAGLWDEDLNLALYCCYELHYRGLDGVSDEWEWHPDLLRFRAALEDAFLSSLILEIGPPGGAADVGRRLPAIVAGGGGPSLSAYMATDGTRRQFRELAVHRSAYQLKEADPHTWAIPRLHGDPKAALLEIQTDEYGGGDYRAMHSTLFAGTMRALGLDPTYGAYLPQIPGVSLATVNLVSLFGLHRRWRGALVGHLAVFEMASVVPMGRYRDSLLRLGLGADATAFYEVHVAADAVHEVIALTRLAAGFAALEPDRSGDVLFGARAIMAVEGRFARHLVGAWAKGRSSLYRPGDTHPWGGHRGTRAVSARGPRGGTPPPSRPTAGSLA